MLGMGVMISRLSGLDKKSECVQPFLGKAIESLAILGDYLLIGVGGKTIRVWDDGQSCCETRYLHSDDKPQDFIGATLVDFTLQDAPDREGGYDTHEVQFLRVVTDRGTFTVETHNEHNGWYGGFAVVFDVTD